MAEPHPLRPTRAAEQELMDRLLRAFEDGDVDGLVALMTRDVWLRMPPLPLEYQGRELAGQFFATVGVPRRPALPAGSHSGQRPARVRRLPAGPRVRAGPNLGPARNHSRRRPHQRHHPFRKRSSLRATPHHAGRELRVSARGWRSAAAVRTGRTSARCPERRALTVSKARSKRYRIGNLHAEWTLRRGRSADCTGAPASLRPAPLEV